MLFSADTFLTHVKSLITGGGLNSSGKAYHDAGFWRDIPIPLPAFDMSVTRVVNTSDSGSGTDPVVEGGAHLLADETNARVIIVEQTTDTIGYLTFPIPRDYDENTDQLKIRVLASQLTQSTDDDVELDSEVYIKTAGSALGSDLDITAPGTVLSTTEQWIEFELTTQGLDRDDVVNFKLITNGANDTNGEEVLIHAIEISYRSTLVSYHAEDSSGNSLR